MYRNLLKISREKGSAILKDVKYRNLLRPGWDPKLCPSQKPNKVHTFLTIANECYRCMEPEEESESECEEIVRRCRRFDQVFYLKPSPILDSRVRRTKKKKKTVKKKKKITPNIYCKPDNFLSTLNKREKESFRIAQKYQWNFSTLIDMQKQLNCEERYILLCTITNNAWNEIRSQLYSRRAYSICNYMSMEHLIGKSDWKYYFTEKLKQTFKKKDVEFIPDIKEIFPVHALLSTPTMNIIQKLLNTMNTLIFDINRLFYSVCLIREDLLYYLMYLLILYIYYRKKLIEIWYVVDEFRKDLDGIICDFFKFWDTDYHICGSLKTMDIELLKRSEKMEQLKKELRNKLEKLTKNFLSSEKFIEPVIEKSVFHIPQTPTNRSDNPFLLLISLDRLYLYLQQNLSKIDITKRIRKSAEQFIYYYEHYLLDRDCRASVGRHFYGSVCGRAKAKNLETKPADSVG
ncbi:hypothetical protein SNEBB_000904 [Seison nebaliae]|nr:hypothetical protein SNEBB_000904 [Seison nebaliae]